MNSRYLRFTPLLALLAVITVLCLTHQHAFLHALGIDTQASDNYDFFSGVGPMLLTAVSMSTLVTGMLRQANCHVDGCWRLGRYPVVGGQFKVCRRHHPEDEVRTGRVAHHRIISRHHEHRQ